MAVDNYYVYADGGDACIYSTNGSSWNTAVTATAGTVRTGNYAQATLVGGGSTRFIERIFMTIDTSSIPDGDSITAATLYVYIETNVKTNSPSYRLYSSTHTNTIVSDDYDQMTTTELSNTYLTNPATGQYHAYPLNATGLAYINKTGYTKICVREAAYDTSNTQPGGDNYIQIADSSTSNDPYLEVTHGAGAGPANLKTYNTNAVANIKTINTNAIANVKSLNTNT